MDPIPHDGRGAMPPDILPFRALVGAPLAGPCSHCGSALTLHQPDPQLPDRLLGACAACKRWYLVDLLPGGETVRVLAGPNPCGGPSLLGADLDPGPTVDSSGG